MGEGLRGGQRHSKYTCLTRLLVFRDFQKDRQDRGLEKGGVLGTTQRLGLSRLNAQGTIGPVQKPPQETPKEWEGRGRVWEPHLKPRKMTNKGDLRGKIPGNRKIRKGGEWLKGKAESLAGMPNSKASRQTRPGRSVI